MARSLDGDMSWKPRDESILKMIFSAEMKVGKSLMNKDPKYPLDFLMSNFLTNLKIVTSVEFFRAKVVRFFWIEEVKSTIVDNSVLKYDCEEE